MRSPSKPLLLLIGIATAASPLGATAPRAKPLYVPTRITKGIPDTTLFGLPYVGSGKVVVVGESPTPVVQQSGAPVDRSSGKKTDPKVPSTPTLQLPTQLDYSAALHFVPFEVIFTHSVAVDGKRFEVGQAFSLPVPLSRLAPELFPDPKMLPGQDMLVNCTFVVRQISGDDVILTVIEDSRFPARDQRVAFRMAK